MARVNIYLPDDLAEQARKADVNVSAVAQDALRRELASASIDAWLESLDRIERVDVSHSIAQSAMDEARHDFGSS